MIDDAMHNGEHLGHQHARLEPFAQLKCQRPELISAFEVA
jgi:hypothetical protein